MRSIRSLHSSGILIALCCGLGTAPTPSAGQVTAEAEHAADDGLDLTRGSSRSAFGCGGADADGDTVGDGCDNCPVHYNPCQEDSDADSVGDLCDNCPWNSNAAQGDADGDDVGDPCDNCPLVGNPDQANSDATVDAEGDACDTCIAHDCLFQHPACPSGLLSCGPWQVSPCDEEWESERARCESLGGTMIPTLDCVQIVPRCCWGQECSNYNTCDGPEECVGVQPGGPPGVCQPGTPTCDDQNACTIDTCDERIQCHEKKQVGCAPRCFHTVNYSPCCDGDVDQDDWAGFAAALNGPARTYDARFDADHDGDVDLQDFQTFQELFTG